MFRANAGIIIILPFTRFIFLTVPLQQDHASEPWGMMKRSLGRRTKQSQTSVAIGRPQSGISRDDDLSPGRFERSWSSL